MTSSTSHCWLTEVVTGSNCERWCRKQTFDLELPATAMNAIRSQSTLTVKPSVLIIKNSPTKCMSTSRQVSLMRPHVTNNHNIGNKNCSYVFSVHVIVCGLKKIKLRGFLPRHPRLPSQLQNIIAITELWPGWRHLVNAYGVKPVGSVQVSLQPKMRYIRIPVFSFGFRVSCLSDEFSTLASFLSDTPAYSLRFFNTDSQFRYTVGYLILCCCMLE